MSMRKRTFTTVDLVRLPKMDALSAQALGTQVITNASTLIDVPAPVTESLAEVVRTLDALNRAVGSRLPVTAYADPLRTKLADVVLDACWSGLLDWLTGWAKHSGLPEAQVAGSLRAQLFPQGLKFITLAYRREWAESNMRLLIIEERQLEPAIHELGGARLLENLRAAHKEYGAAQGITSIVGTDISAPTIRDTLDRFTDALRRFVVQATAMVRTNDPATEELSRQLLAPIQSWETVGGKGRTQEQPAEAPSEEPPAIGEPASPPTNTPSPS